MPDRFRRTEVDPETINDVFRQNLLGDPKNGSSAARPLIVTPAGRHSSRRKGISNMKRNRRTVTKSPRRSYYFVAKPKPPEVCLREKLQKVPLADDEQFLAGVKEELQGLRKRVRIEILQKLQLLKQLKAYKSQVEK